MTAWRLARRVTRAFLLGVIGVPCHSHVVSSRSSNRRRTTAWHHHTAQRELKGSQHRDESREPTTHGPIIAEPSLRRGQESPQMQ
jgi:hypothetical protein